MKIVSVVLAFAFSLSAAPAFAEDWFEIKSVHSGQCVEVGNGEPNNGATINQWPCLKGGNQLWAWDGKRLKNQRSGKCLDVPGRSKDDIIQLQQYNCGKAENQYFEYTSDKRLIAQHSGKCVDIAGAKTTDGEKVIQFRCKPNNFTNQQFDLVKVE